MAKYKSLNFANKQEAIERIKQFINDNDFDMEQYDFIWGCLIHTLTEDYDLISWSASDLDMSIYKKHYQSCIDKLNKDK